MLIPEEHVIEYATGSVVGEKFRIEEKLGSGAFGTVYKATQLGLDRLVALKILHCQLLVEQQAKQRFLREAKAAKNFTHQNLAKVFEFGILSDQNTAFIAMQLVGGQSLKERLRADGPLRADEALILFLQSARGIGHAHENDVLHRDIKPENIMLTHDASGQLEIKVIDFGLARPRGEWAQNTAQFTKIGSTVGTPPYMSPEQCLGKELTVRSDVYSLGCTMYEAVTGAPPFARAGIMECMHMHVCNDPARFSIQSENNLLAASLSAVIMRCLQKAPEQRFSSMQELVEELEAVGSGEELDPEEYWSTGAAEVEIQHSKGSETEPGHESESAATGAWNASWSVPLLLVVLSILGGLAYYFPVSSIWTHPENDPPTTSTPDNQYNRRTTAFDLLRRRGIIEHSHFPGYLLYRVENGLKIGTWRNDHLDPVATVPVDAYSFCHQGSNFFWLTKSTDGFRVIHSILKDNGGFDTDKTPVLKLASSNPPPYALRIKPGDQTPCYSTVSTARSAKSPGISICGVFDHDAVWFPMEVEPYNAEFVFGPDDSVWAVQKSGLNGELYSLLYDRARRNQTDEDWNCTGIDQERVPLCKHMAIDQHGRVWIIDTKGRLRLSCCVITEVGTVININLPSQYQLVDLDAEPEVND